MTHPNAPRVALAILLLVSAAGFAIASAAERAKERSAGAGLSAPEGSAAREAAERSTPFMVTTTTVAQAREATKAAAPTVAPTTAPEGSPAREAAERARRSGATSTSTTPSAPTTTATTVTVASVPTAVAPTTAAPSPPPVVGETLFGLRTESAGATTAGVLALVAAAVLVLVLPDRRLLLGVAALALLLALLDGREALHQHDEARPGLVAAAVFLAVAHLAAAGLSVIVYVRGRAITLGT